MKRVVSNVFMGIALYLAYFKEVKGAENIALFYAWFIIILSFMAQAEEFQKKEKYRKRVIPVSLNVSLDIAVTAVFVWFGAWITGAFYLLHFFLLETAISKIKDAHNKSVAVNGKKPRKSPDSRVRGGRAEG